METRRIEGDDVVDGRAHSVGRGRRATRAGTNTLRPTLEDVFVQLTGLSAEVMLAEKAEGGKGGGNAGG